MSKSVCLEFFFQSWWSFVQQTHCCLQRTGYYLTPSLGYRWQDSPTSSEIIKGGVKNKTHITELSKSIHLSRQGQLTLTTRNIVEAQEILQVEKMLGMLMSANVQIETIITCLILNFDHVSICQEIALKLADQNILVHEIKHFEK